MCIRGTILRIGERDAILLAWVATVWTALGLFRGFLILMITVAGWEKILWRPSAGEVFFHRWADFAWDILEISNIACKVCSLFFAFTYCARVAREWKFARFLPGVSSIALNFEDIMEGCAVKFWSASGSGQCLGKHFFWSLLLFSDFWCMVFFRVISSLFWHWSEGKFCCSVKSYFICWVIFRRFSLTTSSGALEMKKLCSFFYAGPKMLRL